MDSLAERTQRAMEDIAEALAVAKPVQPPGAPQGAPGAAPAPMPQGMPPGALSRPSGPPAMGPGGMPPQRPAMSPLTMSSSFKSPPLAAALQGAEGMKGHPALNVPTGFAATPPRGF